jgi:uncharacterized protein YjiS (DUF1127 family)
MSSIHFLYRPDSPSNAIPREKSDRLIHRTAETVGRWFERFNQRVSLQDLDDYLLQDIGKTREQVEAELRKPFWKA